MLPTLARTMLFVALASCGARDNAANKGDATVENATIAKLNLSSNAFQNGQPIPVQYTCDGGNEAPALHWGDPPTGTKSFAFVIDDPDAPSGVFRHWGVFDIPASARTVGGGQHVGTEVRNDFGKPGYGGPCPPKGSEAHHYHFKLFALGGAPLGLGPNSTVVDVENEATRHAIGEGELIGTYERK